MMTLMMDLATDLVAEDSAHRHHVVAAADLEGASWFYHQMVFSLGSLCTVVIVCI